MSGFEQRRGMALAILNSDAHLTRKAGSFLGQCSVDHAPLSPKQTEWLEQLAERAGLSMMEMIHD